ncbi:MAG: hypothetical protein JO281_20510 [Pseudonocardiales bacterium]|nr:hypothetical protein [Pseudonocardiales bacterium]
MRSASTTWKIITDLVADTISKSSTLSRADAEQAMSAAAPVGRMLIAGGHLDRHPVTLIAGAVRCEITTIFGVAALTTEENLNPVPGAADADTYTIHLPTPEPLQAAVKAAVSGHDRLSDAEPPAAESRASNAGPLIDTEALRKAMAER